MIPSITEDAVDTAIGNLLQAMLPQLPAGNIIVGQVNRVASPEGDFVVFWPLRRPRLGTNFDHDRGADSATDITQPTEVVMQIDVHGPNSADNAQVISTLFRDDFAVELLAATGLSPFFADDPRQMPFVTAANQYEDRWVLEAHFQIDPTVTIAQQFATALTISLYNVDHPPSS